MDNTFPLLLLLLPSLVGALLNLTIGRIRERRIGPLTRLPGLLGLGAVLLSMISAVAAAMALHRLQLLRAIAFDEPTHEALWLNQQLGHLLNWNGIWIDWTLSLDPLAALMALLVTGVGTAVHLFSIGYQRGEPSQWRYFALLNLFVAAMLLLVLAENPVIFIFGWEGVGLCSFLLISFEYGDALKVAAGIKAFLVNRVGDVALLMGLLLLLNAVATVAGLTTVHGAFGTANGEPLPSAILSFRNLTGLLTAPPAALATALAAPALNFTHLLGIKLAAVPLVISVGMLSALLVTIGAMAKSAQVPFQDWLPDAMVGPTPVSALLHAATMVTAGVYLLVRLSPLLALAPSIRDAVAVIGAVTALAGAFSALGQTDLKRVLAFSTVSQLGFMFAAIGLAAPEAAIFHLATHAFFKAILFLAAGSVILACHHRQELSSLGGLLKRLPLTHAAFLVGALALAGIPLTSGFFSKEAILSVALKRDAAPLAHGIGLALLLATALTGFYIFRAYQLTFLGDARSEDARLAQEPSDASARTAMRLALLLLIPFALLAGLAGKTFLAATPPYVHDFPHGPAWLPWIAGGIALFAAAWALWRYREGPRMHNPAPIAQRRLATSAARWAADDYHFSALYRTLGPRFFTATSSLLDQVDRQLIERLVGGLAWTARALATFDDAFDRRVIDGAVNGLGALATAGGARLKRAQVGRVQNHLFAALGGALLCLVIGYAFAR